MKSSVNLKQLEERAWKSTFQDGLWDLYLGLILLNIPIGSFVASLGYDSLPSVSVSVIFMLALLVLFRIAKRTITVPRLGLVKFAGNRQKKKRQLTLVLALSVVFTITLVLITISAGNNPERFSGLRSLNPWVPLIIGSVVAIPMFAIAYFRDFPRGYYIAALFTLAVVIREFVDSDWIFVLFSALIIIPGLVLLARFLREHPIPQREEAHEQSR